MVWLTGWNRRKSAAINSTTSQSDYQMTITVHRSGTGDTGTDIYCGGNSRTDLGDIRFTSSDGTLLYYWIDPSTLVTGTNAVAVFWIKIPSILIGTGATSVYMYYDNASPPSDGYNSGVNTFDAFDLTTFTLYNPGGVLTVNDATKVSWNGNMYTSTAYLSHPISSRSDFLADYEYHDDGAQHNVIGFSDSLGLPNIGNGAYATAGTPGGSRGYMITYTTSGVRYWSPTYISYGASLYYFRITRIGTTFTLHMFSDAARTIELPGSPITYTVPTTPVTYFYAITGEGNASGGNILSGYAQNFRVRKYTSPEPVFGIIGTEEMLKLFDSLLMAGD